MQRQVFKHMPVRQMCKPFFLWLAVLIVAWPLSNNVQAASQTLPIARPERIDPRIKQFYADWVSVQQSNIPALQNWAAQHLNEQSALSIKVTAQIPALLDYDFRKTLHINAQQTEQHLIQWLNIHKHSQISADIISAAIDNAEEASLDGAPSPEIAAVNVKYSAQGVTVLPNGKYKTMRLKTVLTMTCLDRIELQALTILTSDCALQTSSIPLRAIK